MFCVATSVQFYMKLGMDFWGVNTLGQYYTEFPMPKNHINEIPKLMENENLSTLSLEELNILYSKLGENGATFNKKEKDAFENCLLILGRRYRFSEFCKAREDCQK